MDPDMIYRRIDQLRRERGLSAYRLCRLAGNSYQAFLRWRVSHGRWPRIPTLEAFCQVLGVSLAQLFTEYEGEGLTLDQRILLEHWIFLTPEQRHDIMCRIMAYTGKDT